MNAETFLQAVIEKAADLNPQGQGAAWTKEMYRLIYEVGRDAGFVVDCKPFDYNGGKVGYREHLDIDFWFLDPLPDSDGWIRRNAAALVEHENETGLQAKLQDFRKLCMFISRLRVFMGYCEGKSQAEKHARLLIDDYADHRFTQVGLGETLVMISWEEAAPRQWVAYAVKGVGASWKRIDEESMSYSDFSIEDVKEKFGLHFDEGQDLYATVPPAEVSSILRETLAESVPLALAISTEKARSELIITPVLLEARRQLNHQASLFSGVDFTVDPEQGLRGTCDYLLSRSPEQLTIEAPVVAVVEAKNENMKAGIGQCLAEMVAARLYNQRKGRDLPAVFGVVTTGNNWKFLRLSGDVASVDLAEYHIKEVGRVVGILVAMLQGTVA